MALGLPDAGTIGLAAQPELRPFPVQWRARPESPADVSFLLDAPAGKGGFVRSADAHLVRADGRRLRLWGVNLTMQACTPSREAAPLIAANLARLGVNAVRFHFLDRPAPAGLIEAGRDDTRALDPAQLDRLDFLIAELKQCGIYSDLNLNVGRSYQAGDGVRDHALLGYAKSLTYFDARLIELQKEYARQLLTHRNPYTQAEYRHEPAVVLVEMLNENSLVEAWFGGRLLGEHTRVNPGTWTDIPASYGQALTERYNTWLGDRFPAETLARWRTEAGVAAAEVVPRLRPDEFARASRDRFHAEATFYLELERGFFTEMRRYLREELGVRSLLVGNSDHGHYRTGYLQLCGIGLLDVVDSHVYWQHPRYLTDSTTGKTTGFDMPNTPMVNDPLHSTPVELSRSAIADKPFIVSEINHPFPNEYAAEGIPVLAAYAALQDWDGVFWYTLAHRDAARATGEIGSHFDLAPDPVKLSQLAGGALLFGRGDVQAARRTVERTYTMDQVRESIRLPVAERPYFTPGFPLTLPLQHAVRIRSFDGPATGAFEPPAEFPARSDTGEIAWHRSAAGLGLVEVNTPRSQALVGFVRANACSTANLALELENPFAAVTLHALDDQPLARSAKMLLTTGTRVANSGMRWNEKRTSLTDWGRAPKLIEPIAGTVVLRQLDAARRVVAQPLDGGGQPTGPAIVAEASGQDWRLRVGGPVTPWYVVLVSPS
jgi:hypothetical protein